MKKIAFVLIAGLLLAGTGPAAAQSQSCRYEGQEYPEGTSVCQAGLRQNCVNGEWQNLTGARCDSQDGESIESAEVPSVLPQGGFAQE